MEKLKKNRDILISQIVFCTHNEIYTHLKVFF